MVFAGALALTACSTGDGKDGAPGDDGSPGPTSPPGVTEGLNVEVSSVTPTAAGVTVRFTLADDRGYPIDITGNLYSVNTRIQPRFSLSYMNEDEQGQQLPLTVLTQSSRGTSATVFSPTAYNPGAATPQGTLVENGPGDYTYTFPKDDITATDGAVTKGVALDESKRSSTHVLWIEATRQTNIADTTDSLTFTAKNQAYYFVPAGGAATKTRDIANQASCSNCHAGFKPEALSDAFHGGSRIEVSYCEVCHNPGRTSNPAADSMVFVHRIHASEELHRQTADTATAGVQLGGNADGTDKTCSASKPCTCTVANPCVPNAFHGIADVTYPQDLRNCNGCHGGAAQGDQWKTRPSKLACGSCHDTIDWATGLGHPGGNVPDTGCNATDCHHTPDDIAKFHLPIVSPDPNSTYNGGTNSRTNAAYLAAANVVPDGAAVFTWDIKSVSRNASKQPVIVFKFKKTLNGTTSDVVFNTCVGSAGGTTDATRELMNGFAGGPSIYFVYGLPQDGVAKPADFNASASAYLRSICNGAITTATIDGPDGEGYYTVTLTSVTIPDTAVMLTGGVGFNYDLSSAPTAAGSTQPLTQTDLPAFPYGVGTDGTARAGVGGLNVPVTNTWKVATGYTGRRAIVANDRCNACHANMGVSPTFHVGQRNDGPSCSWCHTPNRASGGWSANAKDFVHALHAGRVRAVPYTWHAVSATDNFADVGFPSRLNNCEACHLPGTYDFSATASAAALPNLLGSTEATYAASDPAAYIKSPYIPGAFSSLGNGYATSGTRTLTTGNAYSGTQGATTCTEGAPCVCSAGSPCTGVTCNAAHPCEAEGGSLISTPVTAACVRCHDTDEAVAHMKWGGGFFYATRSAVAAGAPEQCMLCHGKGKLASISEVHLGK